MRFRVQYHRAAELVRDHDSQFAKGGLLVKVAVDAVDLYEPAGLEILTPDGATLVVSGMIVQHTPGVAVAVAFQSKDVPGLGEAVARARAAGDAPGAPTTYLVIPDGRHSSVPAPHPVNPPSSASRHLPPPASVVSRPLPPFDAAHQAPVGSYSTARRARKPEPALPPSASRIPAAPPLPRSPLAAVAEAASAPTSRAVDAPSSSAARPVAPATRPPLPPFAPAAPAPVPVAPPRPAPAHVERAPSAPRIAAALAEPEVDLDFTTESGVTELSVPDSSVVASRSSLHDPDTTPVPGETGVDVDAGGEAPASEVRAVGNDATAAAERGMNAKIQKALKGNRDERLAILKDVNKSVHVHVLRNPGLQLDEVVEIARMTNVSPDLLIGIANKREWAQRPDVANALVRNPKLAPGIAVRLVEFVNAQDLRFLAKDPGVRAPIQSAARRKLLK